MKENFEAELLTQIHKQYLENDKEKTNTIIHYLGVIAFVFSAYGYVYSYPYMHMEVLNGKYETVLLFATFASFLILSLLAILAVNLGYSSRKEHLMIHYIRSQGNFPVFMEGVLFRVVDETKKNSQIIFLITIAYSFCSSILQLLAYAVRHVGSTIHYCLAPPHHRYVLLWWFVQR